MVPNIEEEQSTENFRESVTSQDMKYSFCKVEREENRSVLDCAIEGFEFAGNHFVEKAFSDNSEFDETDPKGHKGMNFDMSTGSGEQSPVNGKTN